MTKQLFTALFAVTLIFAFSTGTFAQDKDAAKSDMKMGVKKEEMKKDKMMMEHGKAGLMSLSCDPACGFKVVSSDKAEIVSMTKEHVKAHHPDMKMTDEQVTEMIKPAGGMMKGDKMKEQMEKKMEKKMDEKKPDGI